MPVNSFEHYAMSWRPSLGETISPKYLALADLLEEDIRNGNLKPGTKLPPQRELADFLDLNLSTITRAFKICSMRGLISSAVGSGTFIASDVDADPMLLTTEEAKVIEMGAILPNARSNERVLRCIQEIIVEDANLQSMQYALPEGNHRQREAARKWLESSSIKVKEQHILFANGGQNAISVILAGVFQRGDTIGTNSVIYPGFKNAAKMMGIKVIPIAEEGMILTKEGIDYACKNANMKGMYIIPDYNNPTTHTMDIQERKMISNAAKEHQLIIIEDAINSHLNENILPAVAAFAPECVIHIASLSKIFSPGLRLAYLAVPCNYREKLLNALYCFNISASMLMLEVATRLIESGEGDRLARERRHAVVVRNQMMNTILEGVTIYGDEYCNFRWLILPKEFTGKSFELCAKSSGVQVFSAQRFAVGSALVPRAVRIAIPSAQTDQEFERGLYILKSLFIEDDTVGILY